MNNTKNKAQKNEKSSFNFPQVDLFSTLYTPEQLANPFAEFEEHRHCVQVAFAGRSNVGKSSLLNTLSRRKNLAKVSSTPGKTRSVNLFKVQKHDLFLVDLPGYGYAKRSKTERDAWAELISQYLENTEELKLLLILVDSRIPPQESDKNMLAFASSIGLKFQVVLTKCDKVKQKELGQALSFWQKLSTTKVCAVAAHTGYGIEKLWQIILDETLDDTDYDDYDTYEDTIDGNEE